MKYFVQSQMVHDNHLISRSAACAATLGVSGPLQWASTHIWELVATPGWVEAYMDAGGVPDGDPAGFTLTLGANPEVVTDDMILAAVQKLLGIVPPSEPDPVPEPLPDPGPSLEGDSVPDTAPDSLPEPEPEPITPEPDSDPDDFPAPDTPSLTE